LCTLFCPLHTLFYLSVTALETATMSHVTTSEVGIKPPLLALT
jgi:hypothetical protein